MDKRMPYAVYKRFFSQLRAEGYDAKKKSILVFSVPDKQDALGDAAGDIQKESKYRYYIVQGTDESWKMDNWRVVKLEILRIDYGSAHYWRSANLSTTKDFWLLTDAITWARGEAVKILAHRQAARGCV